MLGVPCLTMRLNTEGLTCLSELIRNGSCEKRIGYSMAIRSRWPFPRSGTAAQLNLIVDGLHVNDWHPRRFGIEDCLANMKTPYSHVPVPRS